MGESKRDRYNQEPRMNAGHLSVGVTQSQSCKGKRAQGHKSTREGKRLFVVASTPEHLEAKPHRMYISHRVSILCRKRLQRLQQLQRRSAGRLFVFRDQEHAQLRRGNKRDERRRRS